MRRFFFLPESRQGNSVDLSENESYHIKKVLRLHAGEQVELMDGSGAVFKGTLVDIGKTTVRAEIKETLEDADTNAMKLVIGQGQLKGKKMDLVIQKLTELGVNRIVPVWSSRCQGKLDDLRGAKKMDRYLRIVESACKQCYRTDLMELDQSVPFSKFLDMFPYQQDCLRILCWEEEQNVTLHDIEISEDIRQAVVLLGPEGGLSAEEAEMAREQGWLTVSLGSRILRAETASITTASIMQFLLKNI